MLNAHRKRQDKNLDAEEAATRKKLWGDTSSTNTNPTGEDMGDQIVLGDYNNPTPIVLNQQSSGIGKLLTGAALATGLMGIPAAGIVGYMLSQSQKVAPVVTPPFTDESLDVGLKHFTDLIINGIE